MTEEQIKALIAEALKSSLGGDEFKKAVSGQIKGAVTTGITEAMGALDIAGTVTKALADAKPEEKPAAKKGEDGKPDSAVAAQLESLTRQLATEKTARETAELASKTERLLNATRAELGKAGIAPDRINHAIAVLHHANKALKVSDSGEHTIDIKRDWGVEAVPLDKGIGEWAKAEGLHFLPATESTGTGGGGTGNAPATVVKNSDGKIDMGALAAKVGAALSRAPDLEA